jgi:ATP-dependent Clp protease ATP-binding subunit ClpA
MILAPFGAMMSATEQPADYTKLQNLENYLRTRIRGQDHVLPRIASVLRRGELGLRKTARPRGSFLLLGPTGVGKTEVTLAFTDFLMGSDKLFRFDMSEYQNQESLGLLLGAKLGERGTLALAYDKSRVGTLLFDEIEKAHARILDIFLQILDAARVTMASGETLDFSGFYVVFTSNIASSEIVGLQHSSFATMERHVLTHAQRSMRPELYARINEKLVFNKLTYDVQLEIARLLLEHELEFLRNKGHSLEADPSVLPFLVRHGYSMRLGARPMRDTIERFVEDAVALNVLNSAGSAGGRLRVSDQSDRLVLCAS